MTSELSQLVQSDGSLNQNEFFGPYRRFTSIKRYEIALLVCGVVAAVIMDGFMIFRLVRESSWEHPNTGYSVILLIDSVFLVLFLIMGILYQRISDIVAFLLSVALIFVYSIVHFFVLNDNDCHTSEAKIRLVRLLLVCVFATVFIYSAIGIIIYYSRNEFHIRVHGARSQETRYQLTIYAIFNCLIRISTMLSLSSLILNLYNYSGYPTVDLALLLAGIAVALLRLGVGICSIRLESVRLLCVFLALSFFQVGFLLFSLITAIGYSKDTSSGSVTTTTTEATTQTVTWVTTQPTMQARTPNLIDKLPLLYLCIGLDFLVHSMSIAFGLYCKQNFGKGLKEKAFCHGFDKSAKTLFQRIRLLEKENISA